MKREFNFKWGIVAGDLRDAVLEIFPELAPQFEQRKQFHEYYFEPSEVEASIEQLDRLSKEVYVQISWDEIKILND